MCICLNPSYQCQMPTLTRGHLGPNLDFEVNCNISFELYYKIFRQDLCRSNDTTGLVMFTFTIIYLITTLGCMCLLLCMGFTWIPSVYKLFSCGAPQLEGFSVSQSNCMEASMDWLHVLLHKRNRSAGCLKCLTRPLPPYQCCCCFFIIYHHLSFQVRWYPGRGCIGRLGQQHEAISWLHVASPLYKWNIDP